MSLFAWGTNKFGQLGTDDYGDRLEPTVMEAFKGKMIVQASAGEFHCLAVAADGSLYAFGRGTEGCMGNGTVIRNNNLPIHVSELRHEYIMSAQCGFYHCLAVTSDGKVYQWGKLNKTSDKASYFGTAVSLPGMNDALLGVITNSHQQYYAGNLNTDEDEQLKKLTNFGEFVSYIQRTPIPVLGNLSNVRITNVAAGYSFSLACSESGEVYGWGFNDKGQLGLGHRFNQEHPQKIKALEGIKVVELSCGQQHSACVTEDGRIFTWGLNVFGQLGLGHLEEQLEPKHVVLLKEHNMISVACGSEHTIALTDKGKVYTWGSSEYGQQGSSVGNFEDWGSGNRASKTQSQQHASPKLLDAFDDKIITQIACGYLHNVAVTKEGLVFTWGWGSSGQLGHADRKYQLVPRIVQGVSDIVSVSAGSKHTLCINAGSTTTFAFDFKHLVNNQLYSDLELIVDGKSFFAHKSIISARCPALAAHLLFNHRNLGSTPNSIHIPNTKYHPFHMLLHYLYTDHVPPKSHLFKDVVALAKRFRLPHLEALCTRTGNRSKLTVSSSFSADMNHLVKSGMFADLVCQLDDGTKIKAHRVILGTRCDYFKTMFECGFKEHNQTLIPFPSIEREAFESVLEFMYAGETQLDSETVVEILTAADRLLLDDLKVKCEVVLSELVDEENCNDLLDISERFSAPRLRKHCNEWKSKLALTAGA